MTAKERLKEAVEAMRNLRGISAAEWASRFPTFHEAVRLSILTPSGQAWDRELAAMNTELQLRIAEAILSA